MGESDGSDEGAEDEDRGPVAEAEPFRGEVAGGGAECEGEQDGEPVEGLAPDREDGVDREGPLHRVPDREDPGEHDREDRRRDLQGHAEAVRQVVGDQRPDDADQHDRDPVDGRKVAVQAELDDERGNQQTDMTSVVVVSPRPRLSFR